MLAADDSTSLCCVAVAFLVRLGPLGNIFEGAPR